MAHVSLSAISSLSGAEPVSSKTSSEKSSERCNDGGLNLKATELRLGLPGSEWLDPLQKSFVSGAKRVFSVAIDGGSGKWVFAGNGGSEFELGKAGNLFTARTVTSAGKNGVSPSPESLPEKTSQLSSPAAKDQVVGWPPIRSFRKNSMVSCSKNLENAEKKAGSASLYIKISMDGAPYLRKIDLKTCNCYSDLSSALGTMFNRFTIGGSSRDGFNERRLIDLVHGSEYVVTYEDKDGDWMLVGDVPWEMFIDSCKRMRIMKSSEAIGLGDTLFSEKV